MDMLSLQEVLTAIISAVLLVALNKIRGLSKTCKALQSNPPKYHIDCEQCLYYLQATGKGDHAIWEDPKI